MKKKLYKQIYLDGIRSFWYFPTLSFVLFIVGFWGLCNLGESFLMTAPNKARLVNLFYIYEGSILLMIPFLLYLFRRFLVNKRTETYEKKLLGFIIDYGLKSPLIDALQEEITEVLGNQKEKNHFNSLLVKLSIIPLLFILLKKYTVLSLSSFVTPLIVLVFLFVLNYFLPNEWVKSLHWATSKKNHQLSFIYSELEYMKEVMESPFLLGISKKETPKGLSDPQTVSKTLEKKLNRKKRLNKFLAFILSEEYETPDEKDNLVEKWEETSTAALDEETSLIEEKNRSSEETVSEGILEEETEAVLFDSDREAFEPSEVQETPYDVEVTLQFVESEGEDIQPEDLSRIIAGAKAEK